MQIIYRVAMATQAHLTRANNILSYKHKITRWHRLLPVWLFPLLLSKNNSNLLDLHQKHKSSSGFIGQSVFKQKQEVELSSASWWRCWRAEGSAYQTLNAVPFFLLFHRLLLTNAYIFFL